MCIPLKNKGTDSVLGGLSHIRNFYKSYSYDIKKFVFDNEAVFQPR